MSAAASAWKRDPRLLLLAALASATSMALAVSGQVSPVGLIVPACAALAVFRPRTAPRGRAYEWTFQLIALAFLLWFVASLLRGAVLAGAAALTFPVLAHSLLQPASLRTLRRLQTISFFQLVALAASTTAIFFGPLLLLHLVLAPLTFTLGGLETALGEPRRSVPMTRALRRSGAVASATCLLGGVLAFLVLPRYEAGLGSRLRARGERMSGFSERVRLGDITSIQTSNAVVMRAKLGGSVPRDIYWRGIALDTFTGKEWSVSAPAARVSPRGAEYVVAPSSKGPRVEQDILVEPLQVQALFHVGRPVSVTPETFRGVRADRWGNLQRAGEPARRARYRVVSELRPDPTELSAEDRAAFLQLPPLDPRVADLALEAAAGEDDMTRARAVETLLSARCAYGLDIDDQGVPDPVAWFLFDRKRGHCEYFATSMAVMLRSAGIPARIVNGFRGGERSKWFGSWIVRQRDAHSWVEAWIAGRGWTTFDPTPALEAPGGGLGDALEAWRQIQILWDDKVIGFNYTIQLGLLGRLTDALAWLRGAARSAGPAIVASALAVALLGGAWLALRRVRSRPRRPRFAFYERAARLLARRGHRRRPSQTPWELAKEVASREPELGQAALEITRLYYDARYGGAQPDPERVAALLRRLAA